MESHGNWEKTIQWLRKAFATNFDYILEEAGRRGVQALQEATPKDSGLAASAWFFDIKKGLDSSTIEWHNADIEGGYNVIMLIQYGHGTGTGGYVEGRDFINPALEPIFNRILDDVWKEVNK